MPAFLSWIVWGIPWPDSIRRGFTAKEHFGLDTLLFLATWYLLLILCSSAGWMVGRGITPLNDWDDAADDSVYRFLTWTGAFGVIGMYSLVEIHNPGLITWSLAHHQFNLVRAQVPLSAGIATLRYATILSGAIAAHRRFVKRERRRVHIFNLALLAMNVLVASRLALMMAALAFIGLTFARSDARQRMSRRRKATWFGLLGVTAIALLTFANYSRNANYYRANYNNNNPLAMMLGESVAYVGSPFQVAVGTANVAMEQNINPASRLSVPSQIANLLTPTFFAPKTNLNGASSQPTDWYRTVVSIEPNLTTNSALAQLFGQLGLWAFPFMGCMCVIGGALMGHFSRYRSYLVLASFVIGYCFAEIWRTFLFNGGIVIFLIFALIGGCTFAKRAPRFRLKRRQPVFGAGSSQLDLPPTSRPLPAG